jgi:RES domain-containing protein
MAIFYRLVKTKFKHSAFSGDGAKTFGGRWNKKGTPCVYLGGSIALCVLETLVHLETAEDLANFTLFSIRVPDEQVAQLDPLPMGWDTVPVPADVLAVGNQWLESMSSLVLMVPSAITGELNALFNPLHPAAPSALKTIEERPYPLDARLFKLTSSPA